MSTETKNDILKQLGEPLDIQDVDFRIQSINKAGYATILAYKDARVDMNRLDEVCGPNWQKEYKFIESEKMLFCRVGIKIDNEWIWREDLGVESFSEKQKGQASDAFKRACFNWGIGRELYDYPLIQVKLNSNEFKVENNKAKQTWDLKLKEWKWNAEFEDGKLKSLTAVDQNGKQRFNSNSQSQPVTTSTPTATKNTTQQTAKNTNNNQKEKKWLNVLDNSRNMTPQWINVVEAINDGKITSVDDVRKHYKVSKVTEGKLNEILNYQTA